MRSCIASIDLTPSEHLRVSLYSLRALLKLCRLLSSTLRPQLHPRRCRIDAERLRPRTCEEKRSSVSEVDDFLSVERARLSVVPFVSPLRAW